MSSADRAQYDPQPSAAELTTRLQRLDDEEKAAWRKLQRVHDEQAALRAKLAFRGGDSVSDAPPWSTPVKPQGDAQFVRQHRIFLWAEDVSFAPSAGNDVLLAPDPVDVLGWEVVEVQFIVLENTGGPTSFGADIGTGMFETFSMNAWHACNASLTDLPAAGESVVVRASSVSQSPLQQYARWGVMHTGSAGETVRFRVLVMYKKRSYAVTEKMRLADGLRQFAEALSAVRMSPGELTKALVGMDRIGASQLSPTEPTETTAAETENAAGTNADLANGSASDEEQEEDTDWGSAMAFLPWIAPYLSKETLAGLPPGVKL